MPRSRAFRRGSAAFLCPFSAQADSEEPWSELLARARLQLVLWAPEGDVPGDVRHFGWLHPPRFWMIFDFELDGGRAWRGGLPGALE